MLWQVEDHEALTGSRWEGSQAESAIAEIVADAERSCVGSSWPGHPLDDEPESSRLSTLYLGSAGMIWALHELNAAVDGAAMIGQAISNYRADPDFGSEAHAPSLWMGETGLLVVAARLDASAADEHRLRQLISANRDRVTRELIGARPGLCSLPGLVNS